MFLDSLQLKSENPFILNKGRSLFSFELVAPFDTTDYTVRVVAFSKSDADTNTINWIDSSDYIVKTSRQNLPVVKVNDSYRDDFVVYSYYGLLDEEVSQTFNNAIENTSEIDATISKLEIFGLNGTSDSAFTLISPIKDSSFVLL